MAAAQPEERSRARAAGRRGRSSAARSSRSARLGSPGVGSGDDECQRDWKKAGSRAPCGGRAPAPRNPATSWRAANVNGVASGWNVWTITRPGASRPLRPASCVTSWNVRSSARKSGKASRCRRRRRQRPDPREVVALRDHLRPDEHRRARGAKALERLLERTGARRGIGVEPDPLESRDPSRELGLEPLRPRADARELHRAAARAGSRQLLRVPAVVAVEPPVARGVSARCRSSRSGATVRTHGSASRRTCLAG